jgi:hypothetical protein
MKRKCLSHSKSSPQANKHRCLICGAFCFTTLTFLAKSYSAKATSSGKLPWIIP